MPRWRPAQGLPPRQLCRHRGLHRGHVRGVCVRGTCEPACTANQLAPADCRTNAQVDPLPPCLMQMGGSHMRRRGCRGVRACRQGRFRPQHALSVFADCAVSGVFPRLSPSCVRPFRVFGPATSRRHVPARCACDGAPRRWSFSPHLVLCLCCVMGGARPALSCRVRNRSLVFRHSECMCVVLHVCVGGPLAPLLYIVYILYVIDSRLRLSRASCTSRGGRLEEFTCLWYLDN